MWEFHSHGHEWIDTDGWARDDDLRLPTAIRVITDGQPASGRSDMKSYSPLRTCPGLFRTFAATPPSEDGILGFANRYGMLGGDLSRVLTEDLAGPPPSPADLAYPPPSLRQFHVRPVS